MKETAKISNEISSTDTYTINKNLKLNTVNEGEPTDNVLVHGADNEVKSVPRSEFGGETPSITEVLTEGNTYSTYGQNDYMRFTNQYAPGWQFNSMQFMPGGIRLEKSYGGNSSGILYAADHVGSLYTRSDFANQTGFSLNTEGLLLKTNVSQAGTGIIKSDNLVKLTDYQLPIETTEASVTLVSKVNGIHADVNGNVNIEEYEFKTINGESILGEGDISLSAGAAGLDAALAIKNYANSPIILADYYESPAYYQGLKLYASTGNTFLENHYSGRITSTLELKPGNLELRQAASDSSGNSASVEIYGNGWGSAPEISFRKRIDGEFSFCSVKADDPSEVDDLTTKRYVDSQISTKAEVDSPVFTGIPTVPTAAPNTNTTQAASTAFVNEAINNSAQDSRPYKSYTALVSQSEENDPTAIVLENTLGGEVIWTRMYTGAYKATLEGAFPVDKTTVFTSIRFSELAYINCTEVDYENNCVYLKTCQGPWDLTDGALNKMAIEVRVYN